MAQELIQFLKSRKKANLTVAAVNILVFLVLSLKGNVGSASFMAEHGAAYTPLIMKGEYYRLFTAMFLHFGLAHLANNMICLLFIGDMVETVTGPVLYLVVCLGGGLVGNLCSLWWELRTGSYAVSAGASGCVFALIGAQLVILLRMRRMGAGKNLLRRFALLAVLSVAQGFTEAGTDNVAHIGGLIGGIFLMSVILASGILKLHKRRRRQR